MLCTSVYSFGSRSRPPHNLQWSVLYSFFLCFVLMFVLPLAFHALHERLDIWQPFSSSPQLVMARFVFIFLCFILIFLLPAALHALYERLFIWQPFSSSPQLEMVRFVFIFPLFCAYFSCSRSFSCCARAFRHWAAVFVRSTTIHFSSVLYLFFFFQ